MRGFLDIGAASVVCLAVSEEGAVIGAGEAASDPSDLAESISAAVGRAEKSAGARMEEVSFSVSSLDFKSFFATSEISLGRKRPVSGRDLERCARGVSLDGLVDLRREAVLHIVPARCVLDGTETGDPAGKKASALKALYHVVAVDAERLGVMMEAVEDCNLAVRDIVAAPYAAGLGATAGKERRDGVLVLDIGRSSMCAGVFFGDRFLAAFRLPLGGGYMTDYVAGRSGMAPADAERLKALCGVSAPASSDFSEYMDAARGDGGELSLSRADFMNLARPAALLCLEVARSKLREDSLERFASSVVLAGGGANMPGLAELASSVFGLPARVGAPRLPGFGGNMGGPEYSAAAGLVVFDSSRSPAGGVASAPKIPRAIKGSFARALELFFGFF